MRGTEWTFLPTPPPKLFINFCHWPLPQISILVSILPPLKISNGIALKLCIFLNNTASDVAYLIHDLMLFRQLYSGVFYFEGAKHYKRTKSIEETRWEQITYSSISPSSIMFSSISFSNIHLLFLLLFPCLSNVSPSNETNTREPSIKITFVAKNVEKGFYLGLVSFKGKWYGSNVP